MFAAMCALVSACRRSSADVYDELALMVRSLEPGADVMLVFAPTSHDVQCVYAAGARAEHFSRARIALEHPESIVASAARSRHREYSQGRAGCVIATDRVAIAIPMLDGDALVAVAYAASCSEDGFRDCDALVRAVTQCGAPLALAREREDDRLRATYDALTGLLTPTAFREELFAALALAKFRPQATISLWFVDTDNFKSVNDRFGHAAGDAVLQRMAALLREHTTANLDVPARNGGDEFCAILRDVPKTVAIARAQAFCEAVRGADFGIVPALSASVGVASFPYDALEASTLLEAADAAMYHSKRSGRNCVSFAAGPQTFVTYR
ncbi:MAG: GGDEF domain-containing protein [Candidatus Eremiobacteraeota bacterium]|nr:GGDEF domain-containing protein [Candidatus Eremiobacteraeota bacterium]